MQHSYFFETAASTTRLVTLVAMLLAHPAQVCRETKYDVDSEEKVYCSVSSKKIPWQS
jgi:hypothetical protein